MRLILQVLGGIWVFSMLLTVSSCLYIGHVVSTAAANAPPRPRPYGGAPSAMTYADRYRPDDGYARPSETPTASYTPGKPMLDPTPPGERRYPSYEDR